jgi:predicted aspartyl protease
MVDIEVVNYEDVVRAKDGTIPPEKVRRFQLQGVVDTGSSHLTLPADVVQRLGLPKIGEGLVHCADRRTATRDIVEAAQIELLGRHSIFRALVEPDRTTALIGAIVLEDLDLLPDCRSQTLRPRDPERPQFEME